jgi:phage terminase large subunit GpA-like protein
MDCADDPAVEIVTLQKSSQVGGTEVLLNVIGATVHLNPAPILVIEPKDEDARKFSLKRLGPTIRNTPVLRDRFVGDKSRDSGNTILHKMFFGGDITLVGVNSPSNLASMPIRIVLSDEDDRQTSNSGGEGDPWGLAWKRTTTFANAKGFRISTPASASASRIIPAFLAGDQRYFNVPCPHCEKLHVIRRENLFFDKDAHGSPVLGSARLRCPNCKKTYGNAARLAAVRDPRAKWLPTARPQNPRHRSYFIWEAYSPFVTLDCIAQEIYAASLSKNPAVIQHLFNTVFGEGYEGIGEKVNDADIAARAETYAAAVPRGVQFITAGIDTQDDRVECELVGWDEGFQSWSLDYRVFWGDPALAEGLPGSPWQGLWAHLTAPREHERGFDMRVGSSCVDLGGHKADGVKLFCNTHRGLVFGVRGKSGDRDSVKVWKQKIGKTARTFTYVLAGVDALKSQVMARLEIPTPGAGYCHFPVGRDASYYRQLTAETFVVWHQGRHVKTGWKKLVENAPNEALDCRVYALAALLVRPPNWNFERGRLDKLAAAAPPHITTPPAPPTPAPAPPRAPSAHPPAAPLPQTQTLTPPPKKKFRSGFF